MAVAPRGAKQLLSPHSDIRGQAPSAPAGPGCSILWRMLCWTHSCNWREESGALSVGGWGRGRWEQPVEFIPDRIVRKLALGTILFWRKVSSQPKVAPWLLSSLRFIASKPSYVGGLGLGERGGDTCPPTNPSSGSQDGVGLGWTEK